ncbi:ASCH domain-containing protein [Candidatus Kaiserbacteria bacterium]|nr:ASCH domain-containing protein [Candidatus Kaiserbacteria bacterium]
MEHVAIMQKSWGLTQKILDGRKTIESRWYAVRHKPWDVVQAGETIYFKDAGQLATIRAEAEKVLQFVDLTPKRVGEILEKYGEKDGIEKADVSKFLKKFKDKNYCVLIFLKNPRKIKPFNINKSGFGAMSAWITVDSVSKIKK